MSKKRNKASKHMKESTSFGRHLTGAMRESGWGLDDLQRATKVSRTMLEALCNEDFSALPAEVYARGFVRSCAVALELDEGELMARYERAKRRYDAQKAREARSAQQVQDDEARPVPAVVSTDSALEAWAAAALRRKSENLPAVRDEDGRRPQPAARKALRTSSPRRVSLALVLLLIVVVLTLTMSYVLNRPHTSTTTDSGTPAATETASSSDWTG